MAEGVKDALTEADRGFDFLGPVLDDLLARQIAEGASHHQGQPSSAHPYPRRSV